MGSPISPIVDKLVMKEFETKTINTATNPPRLWKRYVDETFVIQKTEHRTQFLEHINCIDLHIYLTIEDPNTMLFLDTLVTPGPDNTLLTTVSGKLTTQTNT